MPPPDGSQLPPNASFYSVLTAALNDFSERGFVSLEQLEAWTRRLRDAAERSLTPPHVLEQALRDTLRATFRAKVDGGTILRQHPGVSRFTLEQVKPRLRAELDRRIMASAALIKLNREAAVRDTLQRFSGWATSIPPGGSDAVDRNETKAEIRKSLAQLPFRERRVAIDQGHKFSANLNNIIANDCGALALIWHSHWRQANYNYRPDHKERDEHVYTLRGNWAIEKGLMRVGPAGYYDEVTAVGEEVYCRCFAQYLYSLRALPSDMLTEKGRSVLAEAKRAA